MVHCCLPHRHRTADEAEAEVPGHEEQHLPLWTGLFWGLVMVTLQRGQFPPPNTPVRQRGCSWFFRRCPLDCEHGAAFPLPCPRGHPFARPGDSSAGSGRVLLPKCGQSKGRK